MELGKTNFMRKPKTANFGEPHYKVTETRQNRLPTLTELHVEMEV